MSDKQWQTFFTLLAKIVNGTGSWEEKKEELRQKAIEFNSLVELNEFAGWHSDGT